MRRWRRRGNQPIWISRRGRRRTRRRRRSRRCRCRCRCRSPIIRANFPRFEADSASTGRYYRARSRMAVAGIRCLVCLPHYLDLIRRGGVVGRVWSTEMTRGNRRYCFQTQTRGTEPFLWSCPWINVPFPFVREVSRLRRDNMRW